MVELFKLIQNIDLITYGHTQLRPRTRQNQFKFHFWSIYMTLAETFYTTSFDHRSHSSTHTDFKMRSLNQHTEGIYKMIPINRLYWS